MKMYIGLYCTDRVIYTTYLICVTKQTNKTKSEILKNDKRDKKQDDALCLKNKHIYSFLVKQFLGF